MIVGTAINNNTQKMQKRAIRIVPKSKVITDATKISHMAVTSASRWSSAAPLSSCSTDAPQPTTKMSMALACRKGAALR
jgi:hypothetical protein